MDNKLKEKIKLLAQQNEGLRFLLLFGSRARGETRPESDWDFGYIADAGFDSDPLYAELVLLLKTDKVDLVDLSRANAYLRFCATQDGKLLAENREGEHARFLFDAIDFWCDAGPIIRQGYDAVLSSLGEHRP